jgi:alanyl-tRNA synthetase
MVQSLLVGGLKVPAAQIDGADAKALRETMDKLKTAAIMLASVEGGWIHWRLSSPLNWWV